MIHKTGLIDFCGSLQAMFAQKALEQVLVELVGVEHHFEVEQIVYKARK